MISNVRCVGKLVERELYYHNIMKNNWMGIRVAWVNLLSGWSGMEKVGC